MKHLLIVMALGFCLVSHAQQPEIIKLADLQRIMNNPSDTTYIVNFWATWCPPCVKEFSAFQELAKTNKNEKVKVVMVSLDFKREFDAKLVPFVKTHPIDGLVYMLDEPDYNSWINKINPQWEGEIPVTFIFNNAKHKRMFFPHDFTSKTLNQSFIKFQQQ